MPDVTIKYKGQSIATMDASGSKTLGTQGKYCEGDIGVEYVKPAGPTGTKSISITANGTTTEDVTNYASAEITVNVQGGGGIDPNDLVMGAAPSERVVLDTATQIKTYALYGKSAITSIFASSVLSVGAYAIQKCSSLATFVSTKDLMGIGNYGISQCVALTAIDLAGRSTNTAVSYSNNAFNGDTQLNVLIIRGSLVPSLGGVGVFTNTPFADGKSGGTLYVPQAVIADYQAATNWSTILGYANNQIKSVESTHTDPTAPIDLTLYYADGTPISS